MSEIESSVWIAVEVKDMSKGMANACGIDTRKNIVIKLTFRDPPLLLSERPSPENKMSLFIRASDSTDFANLKDVETHYFGVRLFLFVFTISFITFIWSYGGLWSRE